MSTHAAERPLGGRIFTPGMFVLVAIAMAGVLLVFYRLAFGLGPVSAMNDGYAWGIWKPLNVVTFTGIAAGAYGLGLLVYAFNRGEYHPLVRSAIMAGTMGYTLAGTSVLVDLGRWWNLWVLFWPPGYNLNSVLLEVAICVMAYVMVLWTEVTPVVLEHWATAGRGKLRDIGQKLSPMMRRAMPFVIALAIVLPTMHQSSLGGLYLVTPTKLHALWHTGWLPGLFLVSCLIMGYGSVVTIENVTALVYRRKVDQPLLGRMASVPAWLCVAFLAIRFGDLAVAGKLHLLFGDGLSGFFWLETLCFAVPGAALFLPSVRASRARLFAWSMVLVFAGALYRFDTYLTAYLPGKNFLYFPSAGEMLFSAALACTGVAVYVAMVKRFPFLTGVVPEAPAVEAAPRVAASSR